MLSAPFTYKTSDEERFLFALMPLSIYTLSPIISLMSFAESITSLATGLISVFPSFDVILFSFETFVT